MKYRKSELPKAYVYIVECKDRTLYTGWTKDINKRINEHNKGKGSKYTRSRLPVTLRYFEELETKVQALKREYQIKQLSRKDKINLYKE